MPFRHLVLFRVHDRVSNAGVAQAIERLESLAELPGVVTLHVARSLDGRKGRVIVEDMTLADSAAFDALRRSPEHVAVGQEMTQISDWWIGDYEG